MAFEEDSLRGFGNLHCRDDVSIANMHKRTSNPKCIAGHEADAVAFGEGEHRHVQGQMSSQRCYSTHAQAELCTAGCEADAVAFEEDSRRSLRSEEENAAEPKTVLRDGSYSIGPRTLDGLTTALFEHCLVSNFGCTFSHNSFLFWLWRAAGGF